MGNLWLKIKVWTKVVLFGLLGVYVLLVILKNGDNEAKLWIWFGGSANAHSVLVYMLFSFVAGVLGTILLRTVLGTISQIRELSNRSRAQKSERRLADMEAEAARLQTRPPSPGDSSDAGAGPPA